MSINARFLRPLQLPKDWETNKPVPEYKPQELTPEPLKRGIEVNPRTNNTTPSSEDLQKLLSAIDNPEIPKFE